MTNREIAEHILQTWNSQSEYALMDDDWNWIVDAIEAELNTKDKSFPITITKHEKCLFENHEPLKPSEEEIIKAAGPAEWVNKQIDFRAGVKWLLEWQKGKRDE